MESSSFSSFSSSLTSSWSDLEAGCATARGSAPARSRSPKGMFFCDGLGDAEPRHFLDACFLCRKSLGGNRDIFMYRGNMPFCSEECRQEQIEMDEGKEQNWNLSLTSTSRKDSTAASAASGRSPPKSHKVHVRTDAAVVAG